MIKVKDGYAKLIGTTYSGSASRVLLSNGGDHVLGNASGNIPLNNGTVNTNLNADMLDGLHIHTGRNNEANKVVRTDASGYILAGWINTTSGDMGTTAATRIYCSNDGYIRYKTPANFFSALTNSSNLLSITVGDQNRKVTVAYATTAGSATNADTVDSLHSYAFKKTWEAHAGKTYIGWVTIAKWTMSAASHFSPKPFMLSIHRAYNSPASESYTFAITFGWDTAHITQVSGNAKNRIIEKLRIAKCSDNLTYRLEMYVNTGYTTYDNVCTCVAYGYYDSNFSATTVCELTANVASTLAEVTTASNYIVGNLSGTATNATNVYVNLHTGNNIEYPLVWSNQNNTNSALSNQLYKSYSHLTYNPNGQRITAGLYRATTGHFSSDTTLYVNSASACSIIFRIGGTEKARFALPNGYLGILTSSPSYPLHVAGDSYATGWSRAGNGFYVEGKGVHYMSNNVNGLGQIYLTSNEFNWSAGSTTLYFNYRASANGKTVTSYVWNSGSSGSYASHTLGALTSRGDLTLYGLTQTCNKANDAGYMSSALLIREYNFGGSQSDTWAIAPRLSWHWSGRVLTLIGLASGGDLYLSKNNFTNAYLLLHLGNSSISDYNVKIGGTTKLFVRDWGHGAANMNAVARGGRSSVGMADLSTPSGGTATAVNPNGQTSWHHFINISYTDGGAGSNSWVTLIANKAGTTDLWVRSRSGGTISDTANWAAGWTRILTGTNYTSVLDGRYYTESEADSRFVNVTGDTMTGPLNMSTGAAINLWDDSASASHRLTLRNQSDIGRIYNYTGSAYGAMYLGHDGTSAIVITSGQLIGIGTGSPADKLHVNGGYIRSTANSKYIRIGTENSSHTHYTTDASISHWFNKRVDVNGAIWRYNTNYGIDSDGKFYAHTVYANRSGSGTAGGVSLYSNSDPMTYGIASRNTADYGTHGYVTGDWATYLTMSNTSNRGWIFRTSDGTRRLSINAQGHLYANGLVNADRFNSRVATGTQPYACTSTTCNTNLNADMLDGYHVASLFKDYGWNSSSSFTDANSTSNTFGMIINQLGNFTSNIKNYPTNYGFMLQFCPGGGTYTGILLYMDSGGSNIYIRDRWSSSSWNAWRTLLHNGNYTSYVNNYYWANIKISTTSSTSTSPTFATATMSRGVVGGYNNTSYALSTASFICNSWVRTVGSSGWYNESYGGGWYMTDSNWIKNYNSKPLYISVATYPSIVCNAQSGDDTNIRFDLAGSAKGYVGYLKSYGTFLYNSASGKRVYIADNGHFYTQSYINVGAGNEKNASNPPYVWGVNGSDNFMRTYATSSLSVGYAANADKLDGIHASGLLTAFSYTDMTTAGVAPYYSITVGGTTKTAAISRNVLVRKSYIYSATADLASYWCKVADITLPYSCADYTATIIATRPYGSTNFVILKWNCRTNCSNTSAPSHDLYYIGIPGIGDSFRSYHSGAGDNTKFELWANGGGRWCGWTFTIVNESSRGGSDMTGATYYRTSFSSVQTPSLSTYISATWISPKTLTFAAGAFSAKTYNGSSAVTVNVPTHTSHLTNDSGFWTGTRYWANVAVSTSSSTSTLPTFYHTRILGSNPALYIRNTSTAANTYSIIRFGNSDGDDKAYIFLNGPSRTEDGGANMMTIRNNVGNLRLNNNVLVTGSLSVNDRLVTNTTGMCYANNTAERRAGMYGVYDSTKVGHVWSMGTSYTITANGSNTGSIYGLVYFHTNWSNSSTYNDASKTEVSTYASGHLIAMVSNGSVTASLGTYVWSRGGFKKNGSSDSYVLLGGGGHKAVSDFWTGTRYWANVAVSTSSSTTTTPTFAKVSISNSSYNLMTLTRSGSTNGALIAFANSNGTLGHIGMTGAVNGGLYRYSADANSSYLVCDANNSSVSGGGSSWGSSITVKIAGTSKTLTIPSNPNTHWTTRIYAGASGTAANAAATNPYLKVTDDNTYRNLVRFVGGGATTVSSDASGNITISSTNTTYSFAAKGSATQGIYLSGTNTFATMTYSLKATVNAGTASTLAYYSGANAISAYTSTVGSSVLPIYMNAGVPTACNVPMVRYWARYTVRTTSGTSLYTKYSGNHDFIVGATRATTGKVNLTVSLPTGWTLYKTMIFGNGFCTASGSTSNPDTTIYPTIYITSDVNYGTVTVHTADDSSRNDGIVWLNFLCIG